MGGSIVLLQYIKKNMYFISYYILLILGFILIER